MNFQDLVNDLLRSGKTQVQIAREIGCAQSTVSAISRGENKRPSFAIGAALIEIAKKPRRRAAKGSAVSGGV